MNQDQGEPSSPQPQTGTQNPRQDITVHKRWHLWVIWSVGIVCAVAVLCFAGAKYRQRARWASRVKSEQERITNLVSACAASTDDYTANYLPSRLKEGLALLQSGKVGRAPILLAAALGAVPDSDNLLGLAYFDDEFRVTGVVVRGEDGWEEAYPGVIHWSEENRRRYCDLILRDRRMKLCAAGEGSSTSQESQGTESSIAIPQRVLQGRVQVGLLTDSGERTPLIEAYVVRTLEKRPTPQ